MVLATRRGFAVGAGTLMTAPVWARAADRGAAGIVSEDAYEPAHTRRFLIRSAHVGRVFQVVVFAPPSLAEAPAGVNSPAFYVTDGGWGLAGPVMQLMANPQGGISRAYVVAINDPPGQTDNRNFDFLHERFEMNGGMIGGGGAAFARFLAEELRPLMEARYPLDPAKAMLVGHSFGGMFTAGVLARTPEAWGGYVIGSPQTQRAPGLAEALAAIAPQGAGRKVLLGVGQLEGPRMIEAIDQVHGALTGTGAGFEVRRQVFPGELHLSYYPLLVQMAATWMSPAAPFTPGPARTPLAVSTQDIDLVTGVYVLSDGTTITATRQGESLWVQVGPAPPGEAQAETPRRFYFGRTGTVFNFEGPEGRPAKSVTALVFGSESRGVRARR